MEKYKSWGCYIFTDKSKLTCWINFLDLMNFPAFLHSSRNHLWSLYLYCCSPFTRSSCPPPDISCFLHVEHARNRPLKLVINHVWCQVCKTYSLVVCYDHVDVARYAVLISFLPYSTNEFFWAWKGVRIISCVFKNLDMNLLYVVFVLDLDNSIGFMLFIA